MRVYIVTFFLIALAGPATSGAWPRQEGQWFIASGSNMFLSDGSELPIHYDPTVYVEYGLSPLVTIGLDYHTADRGRTQAGMIFASIPLTDFGSKDNLSVSLGFGARVDPERPVEQLLRGGIHWGRGLSTGWLSVDASGTRGNIDQIVRTKLDVTWGYKLTDHWTTLTQLQTGQGYSDDYYAKVSAGIIYSFTDNYQINISMIKGLTGDEGGALKIDLFATF